MTPPLAAKLTIHDLGVIGVDGAEGQTAVARRTSIPVGPRRITLVEGSEGAATARRRREGLRRLLLCVADVLAAAGAMVAVLTVLGDNRLKLVTLAGTPVIVLFFKIAGLYDREQLRLLRSTLDEAPALVQVAGLYALTIAILQPRVVAGHLWAVRSPRAVAGELHRDHRRPSIRALDGRACVRDRAVPGDRRRRARPSNSREARQ